MAGPGGFEPPTTGLGVPSQDRNRNEIFSREGSEPSAQAWKILLPDANRFRDWLSGKVEARTLEDYMRYYSKLPQVLTPDSITELAKRSKWYANLIRKIASFLWETGSITLEERERIYALVRGQRSLRKAKAPAVEAEKIRFTIDYLEAAGQHGYALLYKIMYYSGARAEEAEYLVRAAASLKPVSHQRSLEQTGYVELGDAVRVALHFNRGKKRCEFLWLPREVFEEARAWHGEPPSARRLSYYVRNIRRRSGLDLAPPKMLRKHHYQLMEDLEIDLELRELIQNRYAKIENVVGLTNYSKIVLRADQAYVEKILPELRRRLQVYLAEDNGRDSSSPRF
ncbi:integrase [Pyrodictium delaneyi]|uniref:integrase n=1 Tax=Pyrodictium delaneyi TaxID=1273541 RepID=UPI0012E0D54B|nr:integrase [Pyrodictium delaneyi]